MTFLNKNNVFVTQIADTHNIQIVDTHGRAYLQFQIIIINVQFYSPYLRSAAAKFFAPLRLRGYDFSTLTLGHKPSQTNNPIPKTSLLLIGH